MYIDLAASDSLLVLIILVSTIEFRLERYRDFWQCVILGCPHRLLIEASKPVLDLEACLQSCH